VLTLLARNYESLEQYEQAKQTYEKILHFEPDYKWVKNELYPALKAKLN
jgi:tetratricopeptide (TPR) repeat protein